MRRKAAFNKSLIKGKQRGCRLSSSLSLDYLSFFLFFIFPSFSRIPDRSSFSVSRLLVYPRHARLISPLSFSVFYARRDYVAGQNMGYRGREEGRGKKEEERRKERFEKKDRSCHARVVLSKTDSFFADSFYLFLRNPCG